MNRVCRQEFKYYLPVELVNDFKKAIAPRVTIDSYAKKRKENLYTVRSIYYDTNNLKYYHEKIEGICNRKKVRIRVYNNQEESSFAFLEIKRKYENSQVKDRAKLLFNNLEKLLIEQDADKYVLDKLNFRSNALKFLYLINRFSLKPKSLVVYEREPFFTMFDSTTRITIDHDLRKADHPQLNDIFRNDILTPVMHDHVILEIKFYKGYSEWIQKIVENFGLNRQAISKYTNAIDGLKRKRINKARVRTFNNQIIH